MNFTSNLKNLKKTRLFAVRAKDSFVYTISCDDMTGLDKTTQTDVAERGLGLYLFLLAFSWRPRCNAERTAELN